MRLASSKSSSLSHSFASLLVTSTGISDTFNKTLLTDNVISDVANKYQKVVREYAKSQSDWSKIADNIMVSIGGNKKVSVYVEGSNEIQEQANVLEYGTGVISPNSVLRVFETKFNDDVQMSLKGYS